MLEVRSARTPRSRIYDLASITKPFTSSLALWCACRGWLALDEPVFPERLPQPAPRLEDLLRHLGGAAAWWPLYVDDDRNDAVPAEARLWPGRRGVYSDVGYQAAARWIEHRTQRSLLDLMAEFIGEELGEVRFERSPVPVVRLAGEAEKGEEGRQRWRPSPCSTAKEVELASALGLSIEDLGPPGPEEPQDGNARWSWRRGLLAGHAGLFGTTAAVDALLQRWLRASVADAGSVLDLAFRRALEPREGRLLGWQRPPLEWGVSPSVFGHFGFTGGSVWVDPERRSSMVLLAHRSEPCSDLGPSRQVVARAWQRWAECSEEPPKPPRFRW